MQKEHKPIVHTCLVHKKQFTEYVYVPVSWSGDTLPVCPLCRVSPYETKFDQTHSRTPFAYDEY